MAGVGAAAARNNIPAMVAYHKVVMTVGKGAPGRPRQSWERYAITDHVSGDMYRWAGLLGFAFAVCFYRSAAGVQLLQAMPTKRQTRSAALSWVSDIARDLIFSEDQQIPSAPATFTPSPVRSKEQPSMRLCSSVGTRSNAPRARSWGRCRSGPWITRARRLQIPLRRRAPRRPAPLDEVSNSSIGRAVTGAQPDSPRTDP
jgi:hypothetical protein